MLILRMAAVGGLSVLLGTTSFAGSSDLSAPKAYQQQAQSDAPGSMTQASPDPATEAIQATEDIVTVAEQVGEFETLLQAAQASGLVETLKGEGPYTIFAPTDEAFAALPAGTVEQLLRPENKAQLQDVLRYHVVEGALSAEDLAGATAPESLQGAALRIRTEGGSVMVNEATVAQADIQAANGVIHAIDSVLMPEGLATGSTGDASGGMNDTAPPTGTMQMSPGGTGTMPETGGSELRGSGAQ